VGTAVDVVEGDVADIADETKYVVVVTLVNVLSVVAAADVGVTESNIDVDLVGSDAGNDRL